MAARSRGAGSGEPSKSCGLCGEFDSITKIHQKHSKTSTSSSTASSGTKNGTKPTFSKDNCPLDRFVLGRITWSYLHTMASHFKEAPTLSEQEDMKTHIKTFSKFYPCSYCAEDLQEDLKSNEPDVKSSNSLSQYFCQLHNRVNSKLEKPLFDCSQVIQRWKDGWPDGRCNSKLSTSLPAASSDKSTKNETKETSSKYNSCKDCPLDRSELGRNAWSYLHTMAAYYGEAPTPSEQEDMKSYIKTFSKFYPSGHCVDGLREDLKSNEPDVKSSNSLSQYFCQLHNRVNSKLGKPLFDCGQVKQRWKDGWPDGRCE